MNLKKNEKKIGLFSIFKKKEKEIELIDEINKGNMEALEEYSIDDLTKNIIEKENQETNAKEEKPEEQEKSLSKREKLAVSAGKIKDRIANSSLYKIISKVGKKDEKEELQKEYTQQIAGMWMKMIKSLNKLKSSKIGNALIEKSKENRKGDSISVENMFHPDFSYRLIGDYQIKPNSKVSQIGYFCCILSKLAYESEDFIKETLDSYSAPLFKDLEEINGKKGVEHFIPIQGSSEGNNCYVMFIKFFGSDICYLVFRGTKFLQLEDWEIDFQMDLKAPFNEKDEMKCHSGFYDAIFYHHQNTDDSIYSQIQEILSKHYVKGKTKLIVTGHSLGGALSSVYSIASSIQNSPFEVFKIFSFGSPRIGTDEFVKILEDKCYRYVHDLDFVTGMPEYLKPHGKRIIISKILPEKVTINLRNTLPILSYSLTDHYVGEYVKDLAKKHKFVIGKKQWIKHEKKVKSKMEKLVRIDLILKVRNLERELKKEKKEKEDLKRRIKIMEEKENLRKEINERISTSRYLNSITTNDFDTQHEIATNNHQENGKNEKIKQTY